MEKIDIEYVLHCVRNSRILLEQNELVVDGLLHSAQMSLEEHLSTIAQQSLSGSETKASTPKCQSCGGSIKIESQETTYVCDRCFERNYD